MFHWGVSHVYSNLSLSLGYLPSSKDSGFIRIRGRRHWYYMILSTRFRASTMFNRTCYETNGAHIESPSFLHGTSHPKILQLLNLHPPLRWGRLPGWIGLMNLFIRIFSFPNFARSLIPFMCFPNKDPKFEADAYTRESFFNHTFNLTPHPGCWLVANEGLG